SRSLNPGPWANRIDGAASAPTAETKNERRVSMTRSQPRKETACENDPHVDHTRRAWVVQGFPPRGEASAVRPSFSNRSRRPSLLAVPFVRRRRLGGSGGAGAVGAARGPFGAGRPSSTPPGAIRPRPPPAP